MTTTPKPCAPTRADRELAWSLSLDICTRYTRGGWSESYFDHGLDGVAVPTIKGLDDVERIAVALARVRLEGHAAGVATVSDTAAYRDGFACGRQAERDDVIAWAKSGDAPAFVEMIEPALERGDHIGSAAEGEGES